MTITKRLYGFLILALVLIAVSSSLLNRAIVKSEIQAINQRILEDSVDIAVELIAAQEN